MCVGVPMRVIEGDGFVARCERRGVERRVSMALVGELPAGAYVLVHRGSAIRALDDEAARLIDDGLDALATAEAGGDLSPYFADLLAAPNSRAAGRGLPE